MISSKRFTSLAEEAGVLALKKVANRRKLEQMSLDRAHVFRQLEDFPPECNSTYNALWEDADLNAAYDAYSTDLDSAVADVGDTDQCTDNGDGEINCDFAESPPSEPDFRSACTAAGGDVAEVPLDIYCTMELEGEPGSIFIDLPMALDCFPSGSDFDSCETYILDEFDLLISFLEGILEGSFTDEGFTNVQCEVGTPDKPNGDTTSASSIMRGGYGIVASTALVIGAVAVLG